MLKRIIMLIFIPTNETNTTYIKRGFSFKPLIIEAYQYHLDVSSSTENTQKLLSKNVNTGTVITNKGSTCLE